MLNLTITAQTYTNEFEKAIAAEMDKPLKHFQKELTTIRTGRASTAVLENVPVVCYGSQMLLKELAALSAPDARLLVIQPWDKGTIADIEKALLASELGLTPVNNGEIIRIQLPMMSTERRDELTKMLHKKLEECRTQMRNIRKDVQNLVRDTEKKKVISEDFAKKLLELLQKQVDLAITNAEKLSDKKEQEIKG